jgi:hypothetical protein
MTVRYTPTPTNTRTVASMACMLGISLFTVSHMVWPRVPEVIALGLLSAIFLALEFRRVPAPIRRTAASLFGITLLLLPFAQAPWASLSRGILIGTMMGSLVGSVSLLARGARRSPQLKVVAAHLLAQGSRTRYAAFSMACQLFGGMLGLAGITILMEMASHDPDRNEADRVSLFVSITRSFSAATMWSPMFSNSAILLAMYPGRNWLGVLPYCLCLAGLSISVGMALDAWRRRGEPVRPARSTPAQPLLPTLVPMVAVMAGFLALVIAASVAVQVPIMGCIVVLAPLGAYGLHVALGSARRGWATRARIAAGRFRADLVRLPIMAGEVMLFLAAGCGGTVIADAIPREWIQAVGMLLSGHPYLACLALMIAVVTLASLAVHPVLSTVLIATSLPPAVLGLPELSHLGSVLVGWCIAATVAPFSMSNIMASRFSGVSVLRLSLRANLVFASITILGAALALGSLHR